jgi:hypothetical protein
VGKLQEILTQLSAQLERIGFNIRYLSFTVFIPVF